jgi:hypothetical protein
MVGYNYHDRWEYEKDGKMVLCPDSDGKQAFAGIPAILMLSFPGLPGHILSVSQLLSTKSR